MLVSGFAPTASRPFGSSTRQRIAFPRDPSDALSVRRHSFGDLGELGHFLSRGVQHVGWSSGHAWVRPGSDPGPSTDVCSSRMLFSKTIAPSLGARRIAMFPRDARACGSTPQCPLRRTDRSRLEAFSASCPSERRTSDTSSPRASPAELVSTGVGPRSLSRSQVENPRPRPTPPSRVNGLLVLLWPEASSRSLRVFRSDRRPDPAAPACSVPFETAPVPFGTTRGDESVCRVTDPRGTVRAPSPRLRRSAASGANGSVPGTIHCRWRARVEAIAAPAQTLGPLRIRAHATLAISPSPGDADTLVIVG